jgi:hypothetical protein
VKGRVRLMTDDDVIDLREDWEFHQATGVMSVQMGTSDMERAGRRLVAIAAERGESVHAISLLVIDHDVWLSGDGAVVAMHSTHEQTLPEVRSEIHDLLAHRRTRGLDLQERQRYEALCRREIRLLHAE